MIDREAMSDATHLTKMRFLADTVFEVFSDESGGEKSVSHLRPGVSEEELRTFLRHALAVLRLSSHAELAEAIQEVLETRAAK